MTAARAWLLFSGCRSVRRQCGVLYSRENPILLKLLAGDGHAVTADGAVVKLWPSECGTRAEFAALCRCRCCKCTPKQPERTKGSELFHILTACSFSISYYKVDCRAVWPARARKRLAIQHSWRTLLRKIPQCLFGAAAVNICKDEANAMSAAGVKTIEAVRRPRRSISLQLTCIGVDRHPISAGQQRRRRTDADKSWSTTAAKGL